jgi:hypothetical protein
MNYCLYALAIPTVLFLSACSSVGESDFTCPMYATSAAPKTYCLSNIGPAGLDSAQASTLTNQGEFDEK